MNIEKYLQEKSEVAAKKYVFGIKHWLDDLEKAYSYDNFKLCNQILDNIEKEVKKMKKYV